MEQVAGTVRKERQGKVIGGLLSKPKTVKAPPVQPVQPIPTVGEEVGEQARRKQPRGRRETFLTGDLIPETEKKSFLG